MPPINHELTQLDRLLPHVRNYNVAVSEVDDTVVFQHRIVAGGADRSYGIHVAQLAGMPKAVIHRAEEILARLEANGTRAPVPGGATPAGGAQLPLFQMTDPLVEELREMDLTSMTPLEAINRLFELQRRAGNA